MLAVSLFAVAAAAPEICLLLLLLLFNKFSLTLIGKEDLTIFDLLNPYTISQAVDPAKW